MKDILNSNLAIEQKAKALIDAANEAGGNDNITVVLVYNDKKQSRPSFPKQSAQKKTPELIDEPSVAGEENDELSPAVTKSNNTLVAILSAALVLAIAAIGWLLYKGKNNTSQQPLSPTPLVIQKRNNAEKALADSLQSSTIHEISIEQKAADPDIIISDTIFINRDSLLLHGNGLTFRADSAYNGPVFVLGDECRYILFDSIRFENFSTAIITNQNNLHLKEVRFINCRMPVLHPVKMKDSAAINGSMINYQFKQDSTINNHR
jgi:hypothetical protein